MEVLTGQQQNIRQTFHPKIHTEPTLLPENIVLLLQAHTKYVIPNFASHDAYLGSVLVHNYIIPNNQHEIWLPQDVVIFVCGVVGRGSPPP